jgi:hypothetical protein
VIVFHERQARPVLPLSTHRVLASACAPKPRRIWSTVSFSYVSG